MSTLPPGASSNLPVSGARLWDDLMAMARVGATAKGGCDRQALSAMDGEGRALLARWGAALNLELTVDRLGNMRFLRPGRDPARRPVAIGSHLDTQPTGGRFDGALGVLAGLEILRAMNEAGVETEAPVALINWTNEEGCRFSPPMMGSGGAVGVFPEARVLDERDPAGARFGDALAAIGWNGDADPAATRELDAYFELHIEQGPVLERAGEEIGLVTHALAQQWLDVTVRGEDAHAGSGMAGRRDALAAAAPLVAAVREIAEAAGGDGRGTVGRLTLRPDSRNVVPSECWFSVDFRHGDPAALAAMCDALRARARAVAAERGVSVEVGPFWDFPPTRFSPVLLDLLRRSADRRGFRHRDMPAGIGHDAVYLARAVPSALVFVPCHGGVSHNEAESITPEWAEAGLGVMADAVLAAANAPAGR